MRIKLAIIGCGAVTDKEHLPAILQSSHFQLEALVDKNISVVKSLKNKYGLSVTTRDDIENLPQIQAAIVAVPPHLHAPISLSLINRSINVYCEKPMATTSRDAKKMLNAAEEAKVILLIGMHKFYYPNTMLLSDILMDGHIGDIISVDLEIGGRSEWDAANLRRYDPNFVPGGVLFESGIHWIYRLINWFGYPELISYVDDRIDGVEANSLIVCKFEAYGGIIPAKISFSSDHTLQNKLTVRGTLGIAEIFDSDDFSVYLTKTVNTHKTILEVKADYKRKEKNYFLAQLQRFNDLIIRNQNSIRETMLAFKSVKFIESCYNNRNNMEQPWVFSATTNDKRSFKGGN